MNLQAVLRIVRAAGLCASVALFACDSGEKKADEKKVEEKKVEAPADAKGADPDEKKAAVADTKAADPAGNAGDPGANAGGNADAAGDAKAEDTKAEGDAKAEDAKAEDAKAEDTKAADKKGAEKKTAEKKPAAEDKTAGIDGKALYDSKCKVCHAADGKGTEAMKKNNIPDMSAKDWQGKHSKAVVVKAIADGVDGTKMKAFKEKLKPEEIEAIAVYVKKMK